MSKTTLYKITVTNWKKYNANRKKSYRMVMISERFLDDAKVRILTPGGKLLFLTCLLHASGSTEGYLELSADMIRTYTGLNYTLIPTCLDQLQSFQMLTYEKIPPFIKRNEMKGNERKRNSVKGGEEKKSEPAQIALIKPDAPQQPMAAPPQKANSVIAAYCDAWKLRYKSSKSPTIMPQHAKSLRTLVDSVGVERATQMVKKYLDMPDTWFVTKRHDIPTLMSNLNAVTQFIETGKIITKTEMRHFDQAVSNEETLRALRDGEI